MQDFPHEQGSDLHNLWVWAYALESCLDPGIDSIQPLWTRFRPDTSAYDAMQVFGANYPAVISPIYDFLKFAEEKYAADDKAEFLFACSDLVERIYKAVEVIAGNEADSTDATLGGVDNGHQWHEAYFTVSELADMRTKIGLSGSSSTMTREVKAEIDAGRIQREGNKPMRIRMDLHAEWSEAPD